MRKLRYSRILIKLSGTAFGSDKRTIESRRLKLIVTELKALRRLRVQVAVVVGGGNIWRKRDRGEELPGRTADYLGLIATVMNGLMLRDVLGRAGVKTILQSPIGTDIPGVERVDLAAARGGLHRGEVVIFGAGTGHVGFTTDTAAAQRAAQVKADLVVKAGPVDGVYTADPLKVRQARKYAELTLKQALRRRLQVMDREAFQICLHHKIPIVVCQWRKGVLRQIVLGAKVGTLVKP